MPSETAFRAAAPADAYALAELSILGGDGMYEFLLEDFAPREMLAGLIARTMKQDAGGSSWRHCFVADHKGGGGIVGMVNAYPAAWLRDEERDILPPDRVQVLDPIDQVQDWESFLINSVAVHAGHRRQGIARRLIQWAVEQARVGSFAGISLNVWEDNLPARALFENQGFRVQTRVEIPSHPALQHVGGSLVMVRPAESS